ncbi:MAG: hypothetical protein RIF32_23670 [Leptospirales bacterium]
MAAATAIAIVATGSIGLAASQRNGQIVRTNGPDPRHVCHAPGLLKAPGPDHTNAPKHRAGGDATLERLTRETRELLSGISASHRKLMDASPTLAVDRHLFVLKDMAYDLDQRSELVGERTVVALRYDDAEKPEALRCVVLDHTLRNHDDPGRWIRRIARVRLTSNDEIDVEFETLAHNLRSTLPLRELEAAARIRVSRRILDHLRDVQYVIDRTLPALTARGRVNPF